MPELTLPDARFQASYLDAVREFTEAGLNPLVLVGEETGPYEKSWREPGASPRTWTCCARRRNGRAGRTGCR